MSSWTIEKSAAIASPNLLAEQASCFESRNDIINDVIDRSERTPADQMRNFLETGNAAAHIFEAFSVHLLIWDESDFRGRARAFDHPLGQRQNAYLIGGSNIDHLTFGCRAFHQPGQGFHDIADMAEAAALLPVPIHEQIFSSEGARNEIWEHHPVMRALSRSDGVEKTHYDPRQAGFFPMRQDQKLIECLRRGISPAVLMCRSFHAVPILAERNVVGFSINFAGTGQQHSLTIPRGGMENRSRALKDVFNGFDRSFHYQLNPNGAGQMKNTI